MNEFINTLLIAVIPAIVAFLGAYLISIRNYKSSIKNIQANNKHEIERLMEQHKLDIDSIKEKHKLEMESKEKDHVHKLEIIEKEHRNEIARAQTSDGSQMAMDVLGGMLKGVIDNPDKLDNLMKLKEKAEQLKKNK